MNWRFLGLGAFACLLSLLTGCASVTHGTTQVVKIETLTMSGELVDGAKCTVANDKSEAVMRSGQSVPVRRSGGNLSIECTHPGQPPASGQATSRVNGGMVGNILIGGLVGAAIDSGTGAGFNYPSWMQLVFGEVRTFDRSSQNGDKALAGLKIGQTRVASASPPAPSSPLAPEPASPLPSVPVAAAPVALPVAPPVGAAPPVSAPATRVSIDDLRGLLPAKP
ncbi:hypothetical protein ACSFBM_19495 [Variovorax sp. GB1R11]|uniref:hypothetical protein n=1 Tax=Variovorax sp. GB1R11 TaxID=3443741 RepID=UPI003F4472CA